MKSSDTRPMHVLGVDTIARVLLVAAWLPLAGCGGKPIVTTAPGQPALSITPNALAFPASAQGQAAPALTATLTNSGSALLTLSSITLTGSDANAFAITANTCGTTLAAGAQCVVSVTVTPPGIASYNASISVNDNASGSPHMVTLSGSGLAVPSVTYSANPLKFGANLLNSSNVLPVVVTNSGSSTLALGAPSISGVDAGSFAVASNTCGTSVAAKSTCMIAVAFTPKAATGYGATLNVPSDATGSLQALGMTGAGAVEPDSCTLKATTSIPSSSPTTNAAAAAFGGKVLAGSLPVIGANVQIYAAGQAGNGSAPTLLAAQTTAADGTFAVPVGITCPYSNSVLYAVARGGHAGARGVENPGTALASVLGTCTSIPASAAFTINEKTTAAMAWSMGQFMSRGGQMGATASNSLGTSGSAGIVLAAGTFANLANSLTGTSPGLNFPSTGTAPQAKLASASNLLNACIVSSGESSTPCTQLYALTSNSAGSPNNTLDAMLNLVKSPGTNVAALYALAAGSSAFAGALTSAPSDWSLFVTYHGGGMSAPTSLSIDSMGRVWVASYFKVASLFSSTGVPFFPNGLTGNNLQSSYGVGVDINDVAWIANEESAALNRGRGSVTLLTSGGASPATYSNGGISYPLAVAFDPSGVAWIVNYGSSSVTTLTNSGTALSGSSGYGSYEYQFPVAIATDSKCNSFVANQSSNTVTFTSADGAINGSFVTGAGPSGVAVDNAGFVWSANYYGDSVGLVSPNGLVLSGTGFTGGGINHPQGIALDGAGTAWVASYLPASVNTAITSLAGSSTRAPGTVLSPPSGWGTDAGLLQPFALAIDSAGNIWVTNFGSSTLTEFIGMAAPVRTPMLGPAQAP